jgi:hypothetical protein
LFGVSKHSYHLAWVYLALRCFCQFSILDFSVNGGS